MLYLGLGLLISRFIMPVSTGHRTRATFASCKRQVHLRCYITYTVSVYHIPTEQSVSEVQTMLQFADRRIDKQTDICKAI